QADERQRSSYLIDKNNPYNTDGSLNLDLISTGSDNLSFSSSNGGTRQNYLETAINFDRDFGSRNHVTGLLLYNQRSYTQGFPTSLTAALPYRSEGVAGRVT